MRWAPASARRRRRRRRCGAGARPGVTNDQRGRPPAQVARVGGRDASSSACCNSRSGVGNVERPGTLAHLRRRHLGPSSRRSRLRRRSSGGCRPVPCATSSTRSGRPLRATVAPSAGDRDRRVNDDRRKDVEVGDRRVVAGVRAVLGVRAPEGARNVRSALSGCGSRKLVCSAAPRRHPGLRKDLGRERRVRGDLEHVRQRPHPGRRRVPHRQA